MTFCVKVGCFLTAAIQGQKSQCFEMIVVVRSFTARWILNVRAIENLLSLKLPPWNSLH